MAEHLGQLIGELLDSHPSRAIMAGSAFGYRQLTGCLADAAGAGVLVPDYRLAPEHPFPAAVEVAMRAYLWMLDQGTDAAQVAVTGDSAGAGLVLSLLLTLRQEDLRMPGTAVLFCPWIDFGTARRDDLPLELERIQRMCTEQYLAGHPADDPVVCPLNADLAAVFSSPATASARDRSVWISMMLPVRRWLTAAGSSRSSSASAGSARYEHRHCRRAAAGIPARGSGRDARAADGTF